MLAFIGWFIVFLLVTGWIGVIGGKLDDRSERIELKNKKKREEKLKRLNITEEELKKRENINTLVFMFCFTVILFCSIVILGS